MPLLPSAFFASQALLFTYCAGSKLVHLSPRSPLGLVYPISLALQLVCMLGLCMGEFTQKFLILLGWVSSDSCLLVSGFELLPFFALCFIVSTLPLFGSQPVLSEHWIMSIALCNFYRRSRLDFLCVLL
jgi:hypothetical protein